MMVTEYGSDRWAFKASSFCAQGIITLMQGANRIELDPDDLRAMLEDHDPAGFYDDHELEIGGAS